MSCVEREAIRTQREEKEKRKEKKKISTTARDGGRSDAEVRSVPSPSSDALLTSRSDSCNPISIQRYTVCYGLAPTLPLMAEPKRKKKCQMWICMLRTRGTTLHAS